MTPQERLLAALNKLTALRDAGSNGPWLVDAAGDGQARVVREVHFFGRELERVAEGTEETEARLIVALHNTIEAQLAILNAATKASPVRLDMAIDRIPHLDAALALADAILGSD